MMLRGRGASERRASGVEKDRQGGRAMSIVNCPALACSGKRKSSCCETAVPQSPADVAYSSFQGKVMEGQRAGIDQRSSQPSRATHRSRATGPSVR